VSIAGNVVTILSTGSTTITAHQIGDANHSPASQNQTLEVDDSRIISATALDFGDHLVGASGATQQLVITNTGTGPLTISDIHLPQGYTINNTSAVIASQASLSLPVTFSPQASVDYTGVVTITSDATSGAGTATITGRGSLIAGLGDEVLSSSAYPNPSKGIFTLALVDCDGTGTLIDEEGRVSTVVLHQLKKGSYQLDLSDQSDGIYLFKYYSGGVQRVIRMVKR
jgi:hypothetical protein